MAKQTETNGMGFYNVLSAPLDFWEQSVDQSVEMVSAFAPAGAAPAAMFGVDAKAMTAGWADMQKRAIGFARTTVKDGEVALEAVQSAKSPMEAIEAQAGFAQKTMERCVSEAISASQTMASTFNGAKMPMGDMPNAFAGFWQK